MRVHDRQRTRAWIGGGIIVLLIAFAFGIFLLEAIVEKLRSKYTVVAVLGNAPNLVVGSRVWVSGQDVGEVQQVMLMPLAGDTTARLAAVLELPTSVREQVRRDTRVRLTSARIIGEPVLDLVGGTAAAPQVQPGDTLLQDARPTTAVVMERATAFRTSLTSAMAEMRGVQGPLQQRLQSFGRVQQQLGEAQREYTLLMTDVRASPTLALLRGDAGVGASLEQSQATLRELMGAMQQIRARAEATGATGNARALTARVSELQQSLAALDSVMRQQGGTVDRLMRDSALVHAIAAARAELDSLIADAKRRPLRYVF